jgi:hypothetical protein
MSDINDSAVAARESPSRGKNVRVRLRPLVFVALMLLTAACAQAPTPSPTGPTSSLSPVSATTPTPSPSTAPTTPSAPASKASAPLSPSAGTIIAIKAQFTTPAQINAATWLTSDAKTFLMGQLKQAQQGLSVNRSQADHCAELDVSGYRVPDLINGSQFSTGGPNCGSGAGMVLWGKFNGGWGGVIAGQAAPLCSDIRGIGWTSTIPEEFYGGHCMENDSLVIYKP